jgi:hypothetical protein
MSTPSTYLDLAEDTSGGGHPINLWWVASQPDRVHLVLSDPRLVDANGEKPGLRLVFSSNPKSADYSPANFNRCARLLRSLGMPAPVENVEEHPRHLRYRDRIIETVLSEDTMLTPTSGQSAVTDLAEAALCPSCSAFVADLTLHNSVLHPDA